MRACAEAGFELPENAWYNDSPGPGDRGLHAALDGRGTTHLGVESTIDGECADNPGWSPDGRGWLPADRAHRVPADPEYRLVVAPAFRGPHVSRLVLPRGPCRLDAGRHPELHPDEPVHRDRGLREHLRRAVRRGGARRADRSDRLARSLRVAGRGHRHGMPHPARRPGRPPHRTRSRDPARGSHLLPRPLPGSVSGHRRLRAERLLLRPRRDVAGHVGQPDRHRRQHCPRLSADLRRRRLSGDGDRRRRHRHQRLDGRRPPGVWRAHVPPEPGPPFPRYAGLAIRSGVVLPHPPLRPSQRCPVLRRPGRIHCLPPDRRAPGYREFWRPPTLRSTSTLWRSCP